MIRINNYFFNNTKIFMFWRKQTFGITSCSRDPLAIRKKVSDHLRYSGPCRITIFGKADIRQNVRWSDHSGCLFKQIYTFGSFSIVGKPLSYHVSDQVHSQQRSFYQIVKHLPTAAPISLSSVQSLEMGTS